LNFNIPVNTSTNTTGTTGSTAVTGSSQNTQQINVEYEYDLVRRPVDYIYNEQNLPINAVSGFTGLRVNITNNLGLPPLEFEVSVSEDGFETYEEIVEEYEFWKADLLTFGDGKTFFEEDGTTTFYPAESPVYSYLVTNNIGLPEYTRNILPADYPELTANGETFDEQDANSILISELNTEREVQGTIYPAQGSPYSVSTFVSSSGGTEEIVLQPLPVELLPSTPVENIENIPVGSVAPTISEQLFSLVPDPGVSDPFQFNESGELDINKITSVGYNPSDIGLTNRQYLDKYLKPALTAGKRVLVAQIIKMIFGPKEVMSDDVETQELLLESASCGEKMFSVSNNPSITEKELEFNRVELKRQLQSGKIELTVSCQKVEIQLPENFEEEFDLLPSEEVGIPESERPNPANSFILLENFVQSEVQRQRNEEDANEVKKSFFQILIDKIMQYISVAFTVSPEISQVFNLLNTEINKANQLRSEEEKYSQVSPNDLLSNPCDIDNACKKSEQSGSAEDKKEFEEKSAFSKSIINALYSLVLSMLIQKLLTEAKAQIRKLIQEKAKEKVLKLIKQQQNRFKFLDNISDVASSVSNAASKAAKYKSAFDSSGLKGILNYRKEQKNKK
jgi:hypothetical protein